MPKICLSMIVKNEERVIRRCLESVLPYIDAWAIVDTGSTDRTMEIIREVMADVDGVLLEREWVDNFGVSRTQALEAARSSGCDYALVQDADDVFSADGTAGRADSFLQRVGGLGDPAGVLLV